MTATGEGIPLPPADAEGLYAERHDRFGGEADVLAAQSTRLANIRLTLFLVALALVVWGLWASLAPVLGLAALCLVGFGVIVARHRRVERERRRTAALAEINREAVARVRRDWDALPLRHDTRPEPGHPYAQDLDLFGRASLLHLLEAVGTRPGADALAGWLATPADLATVAERQAAVAELAPGVEWRDDLLRRARGPGGERPEAAAFLAWAEDSPWLTRQPALLWAARISPLLLVVLGIAHAVGAIAYPLWLVPFAANMLLGWRLAGPAVQTLQRVELLTRRFGAYADALELVAATPFSAPALGRVHAATTADGVAAAEQIRRLHRITIFAQPPSSLLYTLIETSTLWNVHVLAALEGWQARVGRHARGWLVALGEAEALSALARLAHDNPDWAVPRFAPSGPSLVADALAHPLINGAVRVANDVEIGPPGTFLLVTGSNMAGKSTLLRSVGANVVLAQAGAPVCAARMALPPVNLWTSMRVQDSLAEGVSFFMAELQRLKQIVDAADADASSTGSTVAGAAPNSAGADVDSPAASVAAANAPEDVREPPRRLLYLLDEILQGTNTAERQIAARRIIRLLVARGAIGAVSTHDLTLADVEDLGRAAQAIHLTETVAEDGAGPLMAFDYRVRPGIARSTNALRLLELVGLPSE